MVISNLYTEGSTERLGFDAWNEACSRSTLPRALNPRDPVAFTSRVTATDLGSAVLGDFLFSPHQADRNSALIKRSDPEICDLMLVQRGRIGVRQTGNESVIHAGDMVLGESSHHQFIEVGDDSEITEVRVLRVPRSLLSLDVGALKPVLATRIQGDRGIGAVAAQALRAAGQQAEHCTSADVARLGLILTDLMSAVIGHRLDTRDTMPPESRSGIAFLAIDGFIAQHLGDPNLGPEAVASAHHISVRYLHQLFERRGVTVSAYIRQRRLGMVRRDLADATKYDVPIHALARRWGFHNQAVLSRAFREEYGTTPRDFRKSSAAFRENLGGSDLPA